MTPRADEPAGSAGSEPAPLTPSADDSSPSVDVSEPVASLVEVAVPVPLPGALTYGVPPPLRGRRLVGCRVRVEVGRRRLVGVVVGLRWDSPSGVRIKDLLEVLDLEPVVPDELLELARFVADYYLCPLGDTVRVLVPADLPPWGDRRVSLTDGGALAPPRDADEAALVDHLLHHRRCRLAELQRALDGVDVPRLVARLRREGRVSVEEPGRRGSRFVKAYELSPGTVEEHHRDAGRSAKGRQVIDFLAALGRPATARELKSEIDCGPGVIRRLAQLGILREFTQPQRLDLDRHRLTAGGDDGIVLRADQQQAVDALEEALAAAEYRPFLLHGMTGAGKTVVYLRAVRACLERHRSAILMVPEIALVPALASQLRVLFGRELAILHSNLSSAERQQEWERIRRGEARVVVGPRSALWAPVQNLGLLVVDEEHDGSYKQDQAPRYNGRDLALLRARNRDSVAVLVSATPSLESRYNVEQGKLGYLRLVARAGIGRLPEPILVDLRTEDVARQKGEVFFSGRLQVEIRQALEGGHQVILLRNRRGYSPVLLCRACGEDFRCEDCGLNLTYHRRGARLECHYCGHEEPVPRRCKTCDEAALEPMGSGTERVEEVFRELFPGVAADVLDADAGRRTGGAAAVLERFRSGETQVLVGTQMVAKGHHFPRVSLAAVLFADTYLGFPDFRAVERTYALLTQLAGRAGRGDQPGKVVIQTFHPEHYAVRAALGFGRGTDEGVDTGAGADPGRLDNTGIDSDRAFAEQEMHFRRTFHYPPFTRMIQVLAQSPDGARAAATLRQVAQAIRQAPESRSLRLLGPTPAPFEKLRGKYRWQLVVRGPSGAVLRKVVKRAYDALPNRQRAELTLDVDPYDLL